MLQFPRTGGGARFPSPPPLPYILWEILEKGRKDGEEEEEEISSVVCGGGMVACQYEEGWHEIHRQKLFLGGSYHRKTSKSYKKRRVDV